MESVEVNGRREGRRDEGRMNKQVEEGGKDNWVKGVCKVVWDAL